MRLFFFDCETYSEADITEVGAFEYSKNRTTEIVCAAGKFAVRDAPNHSSPAYKWCDLLGIGRPRAMFDALKNPEVMKVAHNSGFDRLIVENVLKIPQPLESWIDSAAVAAAHALPRNLAGACDAMGTRHRKNPRGKKLIHRYSKPKRPSKKDPSTRHVDPPGLLEFLSYCASDVDAMADLYFSLPPLSKSERDVFLLNQRINSRGIAVDQRLLTCALKMIDEEKERLDEETLIITQGELTSTRKVKALKEFLESKGSMLPNLQKQTVDDAISSGLVSGVGKRVLEIRQGISKTSNAKYDTARAYTRHDGILRDLQVYHGASTGRETGSGFQVHNLAKPTIVDVPTAIECIRTGDLEWVRALCGDPMEAFSSSIRGLLVARPGHRMFAADFNAIEARVMLWLARDPSLIEFETGDPYRSEASGIYGISLDKITDYQRQLGKITLLGAQFRMAWAKFVISCKNYGITIDEDLAKRAIAAYRKKHKPVVDFWYEIENCAMKAVRNPGKRIPMKNGIVHWYTQRQFLYCELPSGRKLAYSGPEVKEEMTPWGQRRPKLYFYSSNPRTRKWELSHSHGGPLTENVVQAVARDIMVESQLRTEKAGYIPLFSCHDELIAERKKGTGSVQEFERLMSILPTWAQGLKVKVKGYESDRYRKG